MAEWNPKANELFLKALELDEPARAALLELECGGDADLRAAVQTLLKAHAQVGLLDRPAVEATGAYTPPGDGLPAATLPHEPTAGAGAVIAGRYKLLQPIGEGGMGVVWMADQTEPVKRRVAVKLIRADRSASDAILARFAAERQAIALMDHPHIARLLEAGTTEQGAPFFVMELVKGVPLTDYCDEHKLSVPRRLELFAQVCGAVQHAHQKGIIHRDLKPSNILVESHDGKPVPKVIDFGLAKAAGGMQLTSETLFTGFGTVAGTPLYMAPEQATFNAVDVDTRADIYALGVILYELLTAATPLSRETLKKTAMEEALRLIREQEPLTPSRKLSSSEAQPTVAANRQSEPLKLSRMVKGDLDWIVMKALAKERDRRYETASGFAKDIERFLNHEPTQAGPPTASYRLRKLVRRNRTTVVAAGLVAASLLLGIVGIGLALVEAKRQEGLARAAQAAEARQADNERLAKRQALDEKKRAEEEKAVAEAVRSFLQSKLLGQADARKQANALVAAGGSATAVKPNPTIRELLARAAAELEPAKIEANFPRQPAVQAALLATVGNAYVSIDDPDRAIPLLRRAVTLLETHAGPEDQATLCTLYDLANAHDDKQHRAEAIPILERIREVQLRTQGPQGQNLGATENSLALAYTASGQPAKAIALLKEARERTLAWSGPNGSARLSLSHNLAGALAAAGDAAGAIEMYEDTLRRLKANLGLHHPDTLATANNLAIVYTRSGQVDKAIALLEPVAAAARERLGPTALPTLHAFENFADALTQAGRVPQAIAMLEELRAATLKLHPADHPAALLVASKLGIAQVRAGNAAEGAKLLAEAHAGLKRVWGPGHNQTQATLHSLAFALEKTGQADKAIPCYEEALRDTAAARGRDHADTVTTALCLGNCLLRAGRPKEALPLLEEVHAAAVRLPEFRPVAPALADAILQCGDRPRALAVLKDRLAHALPELAAGAVPNSERLAELDTAGRIQLQAEAYAEAEPALRASLVARLKQEPMSWRAFNTKAMLGTSLLGQGKLTEAELLLADGFGGLKRLGKAVPANVKPSRSDGLSRVVKLYQTFGKPAEAAKWRKELEDTKGPPAIPPTGPTPTTPGR